MPFAISTLIGLAFAGRLYISFGQLGRPIQWQQALLYSLADWYVFALLSFIPVQLSRQWSLEASNWVRNAFVHLGASLFFSLAWVTIRAVIMLWHGAPDGRVLSLDKALPQLMSRTWHFNLLIYWVILSVTHAVEYYKKFQDRSLRSAELEKSLALAKLQALQMQLNPHFLFNSLHAIAELMHRDVELADRMLTRLSELLRFALDTSNTQEVPLEKEIQFLGRYLEIEQTRFGNRLSVTMDIPKETLQAMVPNLVLQPLVENAIRHGIEPVARPGRIELQARRDGEWLELFVTDNGKGLPSGPSASREGIGLSNTRARLQELYGPDYVLSLAPHSPEGVCARVRLPWSLRPSLAASGSGSGQASNTNENQRRDRG